MRVADPCAAGKAIIEEVVPVKRREVFGGCKVTAPRPIRVVIVDGQRPGIGVEEIKLQRERAPARQTQYRQVTLPGSVELDASHFVGGGRQPGRWRRTAALRRVRGFPRAGTRTSETKHKNRPLPPRMLHCLRKDFHAAQGTP